MSIKHSDPSESIYVINPLVLKVRKRSPKNTIQITALISIVQEPFDILRIDKSYGKIFDDHGTGKFLSVLQICRTDD